MTHAITRRLAALFGGAVLAASAPGCDGGGPSAVPSGDAATAVSSATPTPAEDAHGKTKAHGKVRGRQTTGGPQPIPSS